MKKLILIFISAVMLACNQNPITGRKQLLLVSDTQMDSMGMQEYQQFLSENKTKVATTGTDAAMVKRVGTRIAAAVSDYMTQKGLGDKMKGYKWEFNLINDPTVNAWCMPGGKVVVYSGLLPVTKNEAGLAVVLGHEISHAIANHSSERMSNMMVEQLGLSALDAALQSKPEQTRNLFEGAVGLGSQVGIMLPFSRKQESEADQMGLIFMAMAGYDPHEGVTLWERMSAQSQGAPPEFLSDHPSDQTRIDNIKNKYLPDALKYYKK